ncbi:D-alanyl-D-alanine dipeptidase [Legionella spiritensis]|uniref:D-alanyl-D-alanine dipeptidase n=2 Tax=Legionella spiritensis TaxID=452 RepID=A0A0W0Z6Z2_LEGSP|nr:D-alanyl-D-alanine dipeptidase [Legionella spiritensis]SNV47951.1 D-alanyl-D-alanine dipeptidase [Legionella spiritensis]
MAGSLVSAFRGCCDKLNQCLYNFVTFVIPLICLMPTTTDVVLIASKEIIAIPIHENQDPLIDVTGCTRIMIGPSPEIPDNRDYTRMRREVYQRLLTAQRLLPSPLRFCLYEGYRSLSLQKALFDERYQQLTEKYQTWTHERLFQETTKLISPVTNLDGSRNIPPHATGAAIDVYLVDERGRAIDMGIHPKDWMTDTDVILSPTDSSFISSDAKANRRLMSQALLQAGFINYPTEYWHWSYGDRYWAYVSGNPHAHYGSLA